MKDSKGVNHIISVTRLICPTSRSLSSVLALKRNRITRLRKVSPTGNCHAYASTHAPPSVRLSACLCPSPSGCPLVWLSSKAFQQWGNLGLSVYGGAVGLLPTAAAGLISPWGLQWGAT